MSQFSIGWYLLYTRPHQEYKVVSGLLENSIQAYLPCTNVKKKWSDRMKTVKVPLFPSYVFVYLRNVQEFFYGCTVEGAVDYVRLGKDAAKVKEQEIESVKLIEQGAENIEVSYEPFSPGEKLMIMQGPLSGLTCEVVRQSGKHKILVRVNLIKQHILADLPVTALMENVNE
jgi:transcription antitermination factor NusG